MKDFWKKLIGSAKKEVSVEKNRQAKGKLNVNDLIYSYLKFVETEKKRNYKNLKIFKKNFGQAYLNSSTIAGLMRILIKKLREKYGID